MSTKKDKLYVFAFAVAATVLMAAAGLVWSSGSTSSAPKQAAYPLTILIEDGEEQMHKVWLLGRSQTDLMVKRDGDPQQYRYPIVDLPHEQQFFIHSLPITEEDYDLETMADSSL